MNDPGGVVSSAAATRSPPPLTESAMIVALLTGLPELRTQEQAIGVLLRLAQELCAPAAVGFAPIDSTGSDPVVALPPNQETLGMVEASAGALAAGGLARRWVKVGSGFAVSVEVGGDRLGILAVAGVAAPERVEQDAQLLARLAGPLALVMADARSRRALVASEDHFRLLAENASDVVWQIDPDGTVVWVSPSVERELGWAPEQVVGTNVRDLIHADDGHASSVMRARLLAGADVSALECRARCADSSYRLMSLQGRTQTGADDAVTGLVVGMRSLEGEIRERTQLAYEAEHDPLTGLSMMAVAVARIDAALAGYAEHGSHREVGVLCVGVDSLSKVNEALNHAAGDQVLREIASRISAAVGGPDLLARRSGDEFLVLLPDLPDEAAAGVVAERIRLAAKGPIPLESQVFGASVSIGVATGSCGASGGDLVRDAATAMHSAKGHGRDCCAYFHAELGQAAEQRLRMEQDIADGLRDGQFVPWLQPIVRLPDGAVTGYEALVRWVRPGGDIVPPDDFLPVAEQTLLIVELDLVVLRRSVEMLAALPAPLNVAVNVSAVTLAHEEYAGWVRRALTLFEVDPVRLHLEFTETALLAITDRVRRTMADLAGTGVGWYVDDFGTGYSSIAHLRDLPIAGLKLDMSFAAGIAAGDTNSERIARALLGLAEGLSLDTVAEGVETSDVAAVLAEQGWQHGQGWLYGHARPAPDILAGR